MIVYIEYVFINNFIIDFLLLKCSTAITKAKASLWQLLFCAFLGAGFALLIPILSKNVLLPLIKICVGFLLPLFATKYEGIRKYLFTVAVFLGYTFLLGGSLIGIYNLFGIDYNSKSYVALELIPVMIIYLISIIIVKKVYRKKSIYPFDYECEIFVADRAFKTVGFMDTGNHVYRRFTPVVVCAKSLSDKILSEIPEIKTRYLFVNTASGLGKLKLIENAEIKIYFDKTNHKYYKADVALSDRKLKADVILHPDFF